MYQEISVQIKDIYLEFSLLQARNHTVRKKEKNQGYRQANLSYTTSLLFWY